MDKKAGIQKIEALPAGAQRFSQGMRSIGQWLGTFSIAASGGMPSALAGVDAAKPAKGGC